jgi:hypothetical protein
MMDTILWLTSFQEVRDSLIESRVHFQRTLLSNLKPEQQNKYHIFNLPKYYQFSKFGLI